MRVSINLPEELLKKIDEQAEKIYISRSAYISTALAQKLQQDEIIERMPEMMVELKKLQSLQEQALQDKSNEGKQDIVE